MASPHTPRSILDKFFDEERKYMSAPPDKQDFAGMASVIDDNFSMEQTSALPYAGTYRGPQGMQDFAVRMAECYDIVDVQNPEIFEKEGSDRIVVLSTVHFRIRKTGEDMRYPLSQTFTVDLSKGTIVEIRAFYWDVHQINRALGFTPYMSS